MAFPRLIITLFAVLATLVFAHPVSDCTSMCYKKALGLTECRQYANHAECLCDASNIEVFNDCVKMCNDFQLSDYTPQQACKHVGRDLDDTLFVTAIAARTPLPVSPPHVSRTIGFCGPPGMFCLGGDSDVEAEDNDEVAANQGADITAIAVRTPLPVAQPVSPPHVSRTIGFCGPPGMFCLGGDSDVEAEDNDEVAANQDAADITAIAVRTPLPVAQPTSPPHVSRTFGFCGPPGMFCSFEDDKVDEAAVAVPMSPTSTGDAYAKAQPAASSSVATSSLREPRPLSSAPAMGLPTIAPEKRQQDGDPNLPLRNTATLVGSAVSDHGASLWILAAGWKLALVVLGVLGTLVFI